MDPIILFFMKQADLEEEDELICRELVERKSSVVAPLILHSLLDRQHDAKPQLNREMLVEQYCAEVFHSHFRMTTGCFKSLVDFLAEDGRLVHHYSGGFDPIRLEKKVQIALWYLAHEGSMFTIGLRFGVTKSTVYSVVTEFCKVISTQFIHWPQPLQCEEIASEFEEQSGMPGAIGAIGCTHIKLKVPVTQQESYVDKSLRHSVVLQGVCTVNKLFTNVSVGHPGKRHAARILLNSWIHRTVDTEGTAKLFYGKYHLVGDSTYPCRDWLLVPFKDYGGLSRNKKTYNIKLKQSRGVIENVFELLKGRWRRLLYLNVGNTVNASKIIMTCCALHNFCIMNNVPEIEDFAADATTSDLDDTITEDAGDTRGFAKRRQIMAEL